ncbi:hypothetical protein SAMD00019534_016610, partial [Acytostelium subglobosum LB1]|uniref:hypothetical protein n=1 Tax=Acytostelium subglobosum LB1 TaxID=1410327 RepID=UPI000644EDEE
DTMSEKTTSKVWFITGISQGLGLSLARRCLEMGDDVAGTTRTPDSPEIQRLCEQWPRLLVLQTDLTSEDSIKESVAHTLRIFGRLDVVVNNAGYGLLGSLEELSDAEIRTHFEVNLFAVFSVLRHTVPHLRQQRSGHIINISSIIGFNCAFPGNVSYAAAKYAMGGMSEALAMELGPFGVKVTIVYPGTFRTNFFAGSYRCAINPIDEYKTKETEAICLEGQGKQKGDPNKAAEVIHSLTRNSTSSTSTSTSSNPNNNNNNTPLHLFLGPDANSMAEDKLSILHKDLDDWKSITTATNLSDEQHQHQQQ